MKKSINATMTILALGTYLITGCGTTSSSSSSSNANAAAAATIAVTNPTSTGSTVTAMSGRLERNLWAALDFVGVKFILKYLGLATEKKSLAADSTFTGCTGAEGDLAESCADPATVEAVIDTIVSETSGFSTATTELANFVTGINGYRASCYGPGWTDNATGSNVNRPTGDLGIVATALTSTDTTACAAGQLTALLAGYPSFANDVLKFQALLVAALAGAGEDVTTMAVGATLDGADNLPSITGFTPSAASITRYSDTSDGYKVFYTTITGVDASSKDFEAYIYHVQQATDNSAFAGVIKAIFPHTATMGGSGTNTGLSMVYNQGADGTLNYELRAASNRTTDSETFFGTNGVVDFSLSAFGEDGHIIRASMNTTTNYSVMHYAWQAGSADGAVRAFALSIPAGTATALTGTAYFGFGAAIGSLTASPGGSSLWATKMYCNWLNGLSAGSSVNKVQKQTMTDATGKFENSGTAKISFAPTDDCTKAGSWTISNSSPTTYDGSRAAVASGDSDFITPYTADDIPAVTVTYPFSGNVLPSAP